MKVDSRGRVRFAYNGVRFELRKNGIRTYGRYVTDSGRDREYAEGFLDSAQTLSFSFAHPEFRNKLSKALTALSDYESNPQQFTTDIFIPAHMRSV